jgi:site-specific recombinase XerD
MTVGEVKKDITLSNLIEKFISVKKTNGKAERTIEDYEKELWKFQKVNGEEIDMETLETNLLKYFALLPTTSSAAFNRPFSCLNAFFNYLVRQGHIPSNPLQKAEIKKKKDDSNIHSANIDDIKKLLSACDRRTYTGLRNHTIISLMLDTGIRTSELVRLEDSDFEGGHIIIRPEVCKTRCSRVLYLSPTTTSAIGKLIRMKPEGFSKKIFPSRDGNELDTNELSREFRKLSQKANVKITPYQLRHTFATLCVENGINIFLLQQLMGHSDISMTRRYTDINQKEIEKAHNNFSPLGLLDKGKRL